MSSLKKYPNYDPEVDEPLDSKKFEEALKSPNSLQPFLDKLLDKFRYLLDQINIPQPTSLKDITKVQLQDMQEKIDELKSEVETFEKESKKDDSAYRRLTETCVKYSIQLDRINVIGRNDEREERKRMLIEVDRLSTKLVQIYETHKNTKQ